MIAVGLALLGQDTKLDRGSPEDVLWQSTWSKLRHWVPLARTEIVDDLYVPTQSYARVADRDAIESLIELAIEAATDPRAEIRAKLTAAGLAVEFRGGVWITEASGGSARRGSLHVSPQSSGTDAQ